MLSFFKLRRKPSTMLECVAKSGQGLVRKDNQDSFFIDPRSHVFAVADGMGGAQGGAEASSIVCKALSQAAAGCSNSFAKLMKRSSDAISLANTEIREFAAAHSFRQMGSTLVAMFVSPENPSEAVIAHVGDSRAYRLRAGALELLTHDHTIAGEISRRSSCRALADELSIAAGVLSHILTRAVGIENNVSPDWRKIEIHPGDLYLFCSDGVYDMADARDLERILGEGGTLEDKSAALERTILERGAHDNYTFILVKAA